MAESRVAELRSALSKRLDEIQEGATKGIKIEGENVEVSEKDADNLRSLMGEATQIKSLLEVELGASEIKQWMEMPASTVKAMEQAVLAPFRGQAKSLGEIVTSSAEFKALLKSGGYQMPSPVELEMFDIVGNGGWGRKDVYTGSAPALTDLGFGRTQVDAMIPRPQRMNRVRDPFPAAATSANLIDYFKVTGFAENSGKGAAASVAERSADGITFATKPKSNLLFASAQAPVRTIAHWEAAHRNVLADEPQLQATINNELLYGLALEEDRQILAGSGANEELTGVLNTSGVQAYLMGTTADETKADSVRRSATLVMIANYEATGVVLHPFDWEDIELTKNTLGSYVLAANVAIGAEQRLWRLPVVATTAMSEGTFLTGAFGLGAQLYDRQLANVRIAEQHASFFVQNAIAILVEERLALAVKRPESFVIGTFI